MKNKIETEVTSKKQADELIAKLKAMTFEKELPKSWEELKEIEGFYISGGSLVYSYKQSVPSYGDINVFATKKQVESSLAKAQLSQLMKVYNDGWVADWVDNNEKYCICRKENGIGIYCYIFTYEFLSFKDKETRDLFYENHIELIKTYFEL